MGAIRSNRTSTAVRAGGVVALLAIALVACASPYSSPTGNPPPEDPITSSRNSATAPAGFLDRDELPSCGEVVLEQGETIPDDAVECMDTAFASGAELVVQAPTVEGDPIVTYYRVGPAIDGVEIFIDSTFDHYGFGWSHQQCAVTTTFLEHYDCVEVD